MFKTTILAACFALMSFGTFAGTTEPADTESQQRQGAEIATPNPVRHVTPPQPLERHGDVVYPPVPEGLYEEGVVIVTFVVGTDGAVSDIAIKLSSGYTALDAAALRTVSNWHYSPGMQDGKPIKSRMQTTFLYSLGLGKEHP